MTESDGIQWTNTSVLKLAKGENPIAVVERKARELVLQARDKGWQGPPFNPVTIAEILNIPLEANADVADARTVASEGRIRIQFNPTQPRERVRFSIAHELAHTLFPDVADAVRHRAVPTTSDAWQLEMLCNLAAAEFVMPIGSLRAREKTPSIEDLMIERRKFDVSARSVPNSDSKSCTGPHRDVLRLAADDPIRRLGISNRIHDSVAVCACVSNCGTGRACWQCRVLLHCNWIYRKAK